MNAPRLALEKSAPSLLFSRLAISSSRSSRPCQHILRQFSQSKYWTASSEKISPAPSYQPYPLAKPPAGPRNNDIPESSIASPIPQVHETRPPPSSPAAPKESVTQKAESPAAVTEKEAQKPKPAPERKRKLRPRKAALKLSPTAVEHLREMLEGPEPKMIKVGVRNRGCSGLAYHLDWVDKAGPFDEEVEQDGVKVLIDSKALFSIIGSEMDWIEDKLSQRFTFKNPNIKEECGCGESFMV